MPHIFISYAKKDTRDLALLLDERLNAIDNITAWVDRSLRAGSSWELQIENEIDLCDVMIVLYSKDVLRHKQGLPESYVLREIAYAKQKSKHILPIKVDEIDLPISLVLEHYIDFTLKGLTVEDLLNALLPELITDTIPVETLSDNEEFYDAIEIARKFEGNSNRDWQPITKTFRVKGIAFDMCLVPSGSFVMGDDSGRSNEKPAHEQQIAQSYWIGMYPVTNEQWSKAVRNSNGFVESPTWVRWYEDKAKQSHPVVAVSWEQCLTLTDWLGEEWMLPSELQWEYAARGVDSLKYAFGNEFDPTLTIYETNSGKSTAMVDSLNASASWVGAKHMNGNVWEWTTSVYDDYPYKANDGRERIDADELRVLRGGSWFDNLDRVSSTSRLYLQQANREFNLGGLRLVRTIT